MTQEDAAEQILVSVEFYSRIERGTALPSLKTLIRMAVTFGVGTDKLIGLTEGEEAQRLIKEFSTPLPEDPPELKRMMRRLRSEPIDQVRVVVNIVNSVLNAMERRIAEIQAQSTTASEQPEGGENTPGDDARTSPNDGHESAPEENAAARERSERGHQSGSADTRELASDGRESPARGDDSDDGEPG